MDDNNWFITGLYTFVGVEGLHTLDEAANHDGLPSRGSVSSHLKKFNEVLDCEVTEVGVKRSASGKRIEEEAKEILKDLDRSIRRAREHLMRLGQADRPVSIAMSPTVWMWGATPGKLPLTNALPGHPSAEFLVANSARVEKVVRDGLFEIGIAAAGEVAAPKDGAYDIEPFGVDEVVVLVPPEHEWTKRRGLKAEDLASTPLIALDITAHARQVVDAAMFDAGYELAEPFEEAATAGLVLEEALRDGKKPALVPELVLGTAQGREAEEAGFQRKRLKDLKLKRSFVLIYQKPKMLRPEAQKTIEELRSLRFPA
jgi:DNA-binding transcriptional LysR family regulator